jgi:hypothetical protein
MKKYLFILFGLSSLAFSSSLLANDKVQTVYNPQTYQKVCKGKQAGDWVSFAYRGIIWNGSCQQQFFSSDKNAMIHGDEPELLRVCRQDPQAKMVTISGQSYKGKCMLAFSPPRP